METNPGTAPLQTLSTEFESELQQLLIDGATLEEAARVFLARWRQQVPSFEALEAFSVFMIQAGLNASLVRFLADLAEQDHPIPWGHFVESLYHATPAIPEELKRATLSGAHEQKAITHLTKSYMLDHFDETLSSHRNVKFKKRRTQQEEKKSRLLSQADLMRSQGLESEEEKILGKLLRMYPRDTHVLSLLQKNRERRAHGLIIDRRERQRRRWALLQRDPKVDKETQEVLQQVRQEMLAAVPPSADNTHEEAELLHDFAVAHLMWENYEAALSFLNRDPLPLPSFWLRQELLIAARRFVESLEELAAVEKALVHDPEIPFAVSYLRAQALWGLGQRQEALRLLEDLLSVRPDYRSAGSLRDVWREELQA